MFAVQRNRKRGGVTTARKFEDKVIRLATGQNKTTVGRVHRSPVIDEHHKSARKLQRPPGIKSGCRFRQSTGRPTPATVSRITGLNPKIRTSRVYQDWMKPSSRDDPSCHSDHQIYLLYRFIFILQQHLSLQSLNRRAHIIKSGKGAGRRLLKKIAIGVIGGRYHLRRTIEIKVSTPIVIFLIKYVGGKRLAIKL